MPLDENFAELYLEAELDWNAQPALGEFEKVTLLELALVDGAYSYSSLGAAVYLGWRWKHAKAVETVTEDGEDKIFDHITQKLSQWEWAANIGARGFPTVFAGAISVADKDSRQLDTGRVQSAFSANMHSMD